MTTKITDSDIRDWLENDEGLHRWWKSTRMTKRAFIAIHRAELKEAISNVIDGRNRAHYLVYGG